MPVQNISATMADTVIAQFKTAHATAEGFIPVLVSLTDADRTGLQSLGPARFSFVNEALIGAKANPTVVPAYISVPEWDKDFAYWKALDDVRVTVAKLLGKIEDTQRAVGAEAFRQARKFYDALAVAVEDVPGVKQLYEDLGVLFCPRAQVALGHAPFPEAVLRSRAPGARSETSPAMAFPSGTWERVSKQGRNGFGAPLVPLAAGAASHGTESPLPFRGVPCILRANILPPMIFLGMVFGFIVWFLVRYLVAGLFTVNQNERAVKTSFGRAERLGTATTLDDPIAESLLPDDRARYTYPQVRVIQPGGPYFKWPWEKVWKVQVATQTVSMAFDPEDPSANMGGTQLTAVTKDQLDTGLTGQIRYRVSERNLYAYLFGVKRPIVHVMGYFISILRERIANFEAPRETADAATMIAGISINDLRKNLSMINEHMDRECRSAEARYGMVLDASLITGIDPPPEVEAALAAINTAHNQVSSDISLAQAHADQKIVQSRRAVEIETLNAQAEVEPLTALAETLSTLKASGPAALESYRRNVRLKLFSQASQVVLEDN